jgi:hypothetical protein
MSAHVRLTARGRVRRHAPRLEDLESRDLPSFTLVHHGAGVASAVLDAVSAQQATPIPTPHEVVRQRYRAGLSGSFTLGPGRYSDQAAAISTLGTGGSNQSLHVGYTMRVTLPVAKTDPITGVIGIFPNNVATTGSTLLLELTGDPASTVHGLPTHYTWIVSPSSGGIYSNVGPYGSGSGTLDIHFAALGVGKGAVALKGKAFIIIKGMINTSGVTNVLGYPGEIAKNP